MKYAFPINIELLGLEYSARALGPDVIALFVRPILKTIDDIVFDRLVCCNSVRQILSTYCWLENYAFYLCPTFSALNEWLIIQAYGLASRVGLHWQALDLLLDRAMALAVSLLFPIDLLPQPQ